MTIIYRKISGLFLLTFALVFFFGGVVPNAPAQPVPRILLIHSYHQEYPWVQAVTRGVQEVLAGQNMVFRIYYLDTKRKTSQDWKVESGKKAQQVIERFKPDVVITADDNAQILVTQNYAGQDRPFFVFCGVNNDPEDYGFPAKNVTGLIERPHFREAVEFIRELDPQVRRIAVISDDGPTSVGTLEQMASQTLEEVKVLNYHLIGDFEVWKKRVLEYNLDADALFIYMYHTLKSEPGGKSLAPQDVMKWTIENCRIPTVGFFDFAIEDGVFCGMVESGEEFGRESAKMALALIGGADIGTLPVRKAQRAVKMINLKTAEGLNLSYPDLNLELFDKVVE